MVNDGGLRAVLETSDIVSRDLLALGRSRNNKRHHRDREVQDLTERTADVLDVKDSSILSGTKRLPSRSLSELSLDSISGSLNKMNLSLNSPQELRQAVAPLVEKMKSVDAAALLSLNPSTEARGATLDSTKGLTVPPIHDRISPSYADDGSNIVRYLHVKEVPNRYSAGIFVFPPNAEIPLHDHPGMVVISRVLYGELRVQSYDVLPVANGEDAKSTMLQDKEAEDPSSVVATDESKKERQIEAVSRRSVFRSSMEVLKSMVSRRSNHEPEETQLETDSDSSARDQHAEASVLQAKENLAPMGVEKYHDTRMDEPISILSAPHVTCLYPNEGNCHAFVAGPHGAAVLDILFPPYDGEDGRDCTFYEATELGGSSVMTDGESPSQLRDSDGQNDQRAKEFRLTPINQPEDFYCLSGVYGRFTTCDESSDQKEESDTGSYAYGMETSSCSMS
ncbi:hypothetical protein HJC23_005071 [Cyclotella cryptica]|uniref:Cysteine dioxygenase n=1 Tax=Cyclotella cryptica TaxID=29204 RepID=A0ABD3QEV7_9STRA